MLDYNDLTKINESSKRGLVSFFSGAINDMRQVSVKKATHYIASLNDICKMHHNSIENRKLKLSHQYKHHPVKPQRGEVYNAILTEGIGSELSGNHLVIVIQNSKGNIYGEKVNVIPIEGDGNQINPNYQERLTSSDLEPDTSGVPVILHKDPSRIIITDILTIDKARLQRKIGKLKREKMVILNKKLMDQLELL